MKRCPQCSQTYNDDALNFCLADGSPLSTVTGVEIPTVVMPRHAKPKRGRGLMWAGLLVFSILAVVALMVTVMIWRSGRNDDDQRSAVNISTAQTPASTPKPKPSPSPTVTAQPSATGSPNSRAEDEVNLSDEITPIAWETTAAGFKGEPGTIYKFECPEGGSPHGVYGSDIYTDYSSICTAAVHAGVINRNDGGVIALEYRPGRPIYGSTTRNEIKTNTASENRRSFVVRKP
jgi:hypothetical protein